MRTHHTFPLRRCFWRRCLCAVLLLTFASPSARSAELSEYDLKALYLYHFTQFVTWPEGVGSGEAPLVIGVIGDDPFGGRLDSILREQPSGPHRLEVIRVSDIQDARRCHILFISRSESRNLSRIIDAVRNYPVLTVGDDDTFALRGCIIGFYTERNRVGIAVNERAAAIAGLVLSSKLLRIART